MDVPEEKFDHEFDILRAPVKKLPVDGYTQASLWLLPGPDESGTLKRIAAQKPANPTSPRLLLRTLLHVLANVHVNFIPAVRRNWPLLFVSGVVLALCFGSGHPQMPLLLVVFPGVLGLAASEAHVLKNRAKNGALYQGVHALFCLTCVMVVQVTQSLIDHRLVQSWPALKFGLWTGFLAITMFGIIAACLRGPDEDPLIVKSQAMGVISFLWILAGASMFKHNPFPDLFHGESDIVALSCCVAFALSLNFRMDILGGGLTGGYVTIRQSFDVEDMRLRLNRLIVIPKGGAKNWAASILEAVGLAL